MNSDDPLTHHVINGAAVLAAPVSFLAHAPEVVTITVGSLGALWYLVLLTEKFLFYVNKLGVRHPEEPAKDAPDPIPDYHEHK